MHIFYNSCYAFVYKFFPFLRIAYGRITQKSLWCSQMKWDIRDNIRISCKSFSGWLSFINVLHFHIFGVQI